MRGERWSRRKGSELYIMCLLLVMKTKRRNTIQIEVSYYKNVVQGQQQQCDTGIMSKLQHAFEENRTLSWMLLRRLHETITRVGVGMCMTRKLSVVASARLAFVSSASLCLKEDRNSLHIAAASHTCRRLWTTCAPKTRNKQPTPHKRTQELHRQLPVRNTHSTDKFTADTIAVT